MDLWLYVVIALIGANVSFVGIGGGIHYWYYVKNRDRHEEWKLQPGKFLSDSRAREAMLLGLLNMNMASAIFGVLTWGVFEHGWSQLYYDMDDYSLGWAALSVFLAWLVIEASAYYMHAGSHIGWVYKKIHYIHHRYSAPTFWTISAMHPLEWFAHATYIVLPAFLFPMHIGLYLFVVICTFIAGFWDHCGIRLPFDLPMHGSNRFHDDHHKYFHVNFGFTCSLFDRIHDTVRREGHHYTEETFAGGKGVVKDPAKLGSRAIGPWVDYSPEASDEILNTRVEALAAKKARS